MDPFATAVQYQARFGAVSDTALLEECLADASAAIRAALDASGVSYESPSEDFADRLMRVCRSMANRMMPAEDDGIGLPSGATGGTITAGPYSQSFTLPAAYGTPKMLPSEMSLLGISASRYRSVPAACGGDLL